MTHQYPNEYVLVVPSEAFAARGYFNGLCFDIEHYRELIENPANHRYIERNKAEYDDTYKQIIPYAIVHHGREVFVYRRGKMQGEKRLVGNYSLGIGGHMSVHDLSLFAPSYVEGFYRELNEEVEIKTHYQQRLAALLHDDSNDVGKVHLGVIHVVTLEEPRIVAREKAMVDAHFMTIDELRNRTLEFESWSQLCIEHIEQLIS